MKRITLRVTALAMTLAPLIQIQSAGAAALPDAAVSLAAEKREVTLALAKADGLLRRSLISQLTEARLAVDLKQWLSTSSAGAATRLTAERADLAVRTRKGVDREVDSLLQVRLADRSMLQALTRGAEPLYAYEPDGSERQWQFIEAFDRFGGIHHLSVQQMPAQPVFVVDLDARRDMVAGVALMRRSLAMLTGRPTASLDAATTLATTPVTLLDRIRLSDDNEPWISGAAEIYALVTGVDPSRDQPALDLVDMPYLDTDGRDYFPNQTLVLWDRYRWGAADVILMEHDDNTNYQTLVSNLFTIASQILNAVGKPEIGTLIALGSGLIEAMPGAWFTNDDDYVDSYYTLEKGQSYAAYPGASTNALITLRPYSLTSQ